MNDANGGLSYEVWAGNRRFDKGLTRSQAEDARRQLKVFYDELKFEIVEVYKRIVE